VQARPGLDLLAADESLLGAQPAIAGRADWAQLLDRALRPVARAYDVIFIDCGGSLTVLNINALLAATDLLVPTAVEHLSIKGLALLFRQVQKVKGSVASIRMIVPTMFDPRLRQSGALLKQLHETYGSLVGDPIRVNVRLSEAPSEGRTIYEYDPRSRGAADYAQLVERVSAMLGFTGPTAAPPAPTATTRPVVAPLPSVARAAATPTPPVPSTPPATSPSAAQPAPVVAGGGNMLDLTCPHCGRPLQRATVAGYRVAYCDHCRYRQQDLVSARR
jgi:chromosome partitioning protein